MQLKIVVALVVVHALSACAYNLTLYPRGGGDIASGVGHSGNKTIEVTLRGETYTGRYVQGQSVGVGLATVGGAFGTGTTIGSTNQFSAVLTSGNKTLRCEFMADGGHGNGVCIDSMNAVYDLVIERQ